MTGCSVIEAPIPVLTADTRLVIFAKAPLPGIAKTRLIPALGAEGAAYLARRLLFYTLAIAQQAAVGPVILAVTPGFEQAVWQDIILEKKNLFASLQVIAQGDGDLGVRLARVMEQVLQQGPALVIGTDCLQLTAKYLQNAAEVLKTCAAVMHPTLDGGYALLGLQAFNQQVFTNIAWGTDAVAKTTQARLQELNWPLVLLDRLQDIDEPADLHVLPADFLL